MVVTRQRNVIPVILTELFVVKNTLIQIVIKNLWEVPIICLRCRIILDIHFIAMGYMS